jgi:hypothetical protein
MHNGVAAMDETVTYAMLDTETASRRVAVLARLTQRHDWKQVGSFATLREATEECRRHTVMSEEGRSDAIRQWRFEIWGADAPLSNPNRRP